MDDEYAAWLNEPEQKKLWTLTQKDKEYAYWTVGPNRRTPRHEHHALADLVGLPRDFVFMHESILMEGEVDADIPLEYKGCDYDFGDHDPPETRVDTYLGESEG